MGVGMLFAGAKVQHVHYITSNNLLLSAGHLMLPSDPIQKAELQRCNYSEIMTL